MPGAEDKFAIHKSYYWSQKFANHALKAIKAKIKV
jgi:hypothetical protein